MKPRDFSTFVALGLCALFLNACQSTPASAPAVTPSLVGAGGRVKADVPTLTAGRSVFLNRCIQCHALPDVSRFDAPRLTAIVREMSGRANLDAAQHGVLLKYLLTVRSL
jgi:hypothetical protein